MIYSVCARADKKCTFYMVDAQEQAKMLTFYKADAQEHPHVNMDAFERADA